MYTKLTLDRLDQETPPKGHFEGASIVVGH